MSRVRRINHEARVVEVSQGSLTVELLKSSACAGCRAESTCGSSQGNRKLITMASDSNHSVNDMVVVTISESEGFQALFIAYIIPLILFIPVLFILKMLKLSDLAAGLLSLGVMAAYYCFLYLFRNRIGSRFRFTLKSIQ